MNSLTRSAAADFFFLLSCRDSLHMIREIQLFIWSKQLSKNFSFLARHEEERARWQNNIKSEPSALN